MSPKISKQQQQSLLSRFEVFLRNPVFPVLEVIVIWVGPSMHLKPITAANTGSDDIRTPTLVALPLMRPFSARRKNSPGRKDCHSHSRYRKTRRLRCTRTVCRSKMTWIEPQTPTKKRLPNFREAFSLSYFCRTATNPLDRVAAIAVTPNGYRRSARLLLAPTWHPRSK